MEQCLVLFKDGSSSSRFNIKFSMLFMALSLGPRASDLNCIHCWVELVFPGLQVSTPLIIRSGDGERFVLGGWLRSDCSFRGLTPPPSHVVVPSSR